MGEQWKDIAVLLDGTAKGRQIERRASALAARHGAGLIGLFDVAHLERHGVASGHLYAPRLPILISR